MDIHVIVQEDLTVKESHEIGHKVEEILLSADLKITDVTIHIESDTHLSRLDEII